MCVIRSFSGVVGYAALLVAMVTVFYERLESSKILVKGTPNKQRECIYSIPLNKNESGGTGEEELEGEVVEEEMEGDEELKDESELTDDIIVKCFRKCNGEDIQKQIAIINDDSRRIKDSTE